VNLFWQLIDKNYLWVFLASLSFLCVSLLDVLAVGLIIPVFMSSAEGNVSTSIPLIDNFIVFFHNNTIGTNLIYLMLAWVIKGCLGVILNKQIYTFAYKSQKRLTNDMSRYYQNMPIKEYVAADTGSMLQNLTINIDNVTQQTIVAGCKFLAETITLLIILLILLFVAPLITVVAGTTLLAGMSIYILSTKKIIGRTGQLSAEARVRLISSFHSLMIGFKQIRILKVNSFFNKLVDSATTDILQNAVSYKVLSVMPKYIFEFLAVLALGLIYFFGYMLSMPQEDIMLLIVMYSVAAIRLLPAINNITGNISQMRNSYFALKQVVSRLNFEKTIEEIIPIEKDELNFTKPKQTSISFNDVSFSYSGEAHKIFDRCSFEFSGPGLVTLIGESGSGKSTALDLVLGFQFPDEGDVIVCGESTKTDTSNGRFLGYCPQENFVFPGTFLDNIILGRPFDQRLFDRAVKLSGLESLVEKMPLGPQTLIAEDGLNISGGQRQRLGTARSIYVDKAVLLLDEPTSSLDDNNAKAFFRNLKELAGTRLIIVSSHDERIISLSNSVVKLLNGKLIKMQ
jgi:ATP-binding cassette, subfamily B, bacterial PglK